MIKFIKLYLALSDRRTTIKSIVFLQIITSTLMYIKIDYKIRGLGTTAPLSQH